MILERLEIGVTWFNRAQTLKECTEDVIIFLERLKKLDAKLSIWYKTGWSKKEAQQNQIELQYNYVRALFCEDKKYKDEDFPEFTFSIYIWNGAENDNEAIKLSFSLGGDMERKLGNNNCFITLPYEGEIHDFYTIKENQESLQELMIDHWKPQYLRINGEQFEA